MASPIPWVVFTTVVAMRRPRRSLVAIGCTLALSSAACADIDANAPGIELAEDTSGTVELEEPIGDSASTDSDDSSAATGESDAESSEASGAIQAAPPPADCAQGDTVETTVVNVDEWVRLRADPSLEGEELALLPVGTTVTAWPDTLHWDGTDFWWVSARDPETQECGYVAGLFLDADTTSDEGRLDSRLQGLSVTVPVGWSRDGRSEHGGPRWTTDETPSQISVSVVDDTIDDWLARLQVDVNDFVQTPEGGSFIVPTEWSQETEVPGADRVEAVGFPSDDGIGRTVLAQVGARLVVFDSFSFHGTDSDDIDAAINAFFASAIIQDPAIINA